MDVGLEWSTIYQWMATVVTLVSIWYYGNPRADRYLGPFWGLVSQIPWWGLTIVEELWGLVVLNLAMMTSHIYNLYRK